MVGNLLNILMEHDLYLITKLFLTLNKKSIILTHTMLLLAIATNVPVLLMNGFVLQDHIFYHAVVVGMDSLAGPQRRGRKTKSLGAAPKVSKLQSALGSTKSPGTSFQLLSGQTSLMLPGENIISGNHGSIQQDKQDASETQSSESGNAAKSIPTLSSPAARQEGDAQRVPEEFKAVNPAPPRLAWKTMVRSAPAPSALKVACCLLMYFLVHINESGKCEKAWI